MGSLLPRRGAINMSGRGIEDDRKTPLDSFVITPPIVAISGLFSRLTWEAFLAVRRGGPFSEATR